MFLFSFSKMPSIHLTAKYFANPNHNLPVKYHFPRVMLFISFYLYFSLFSHFGHFFSSLNCKHAVFIVWTYSESSVGGGGRSRKSSITDTSIQFQTTPGGKKAPYCVFSLSFSSFFSSFSSPLFSRQWFNLISVVRDVFGLRSVISSEWSLLLLK